MGSKQKTKHLIKSTKSGFTIIEFSLATAFIAFLLVSIAVISSNIITVYQKGLSLKAVNSVGRGLTDELVTGINAAPSVDTKNLCENHLSDSTTITFCRNNHAQNFIFQNKTQRISKNQEVQLGGIFCTGNYSYIWNTYYAMNDDEYDSSDPDNSYPNAIRIKYLPEDVEDREENYITTPPERLLRVEDPTYRVCSAVVDKGYGALLNRSGGSDLYVSNVINITHLANTRQNPIPEPQTGFLNSFDLDLQLYEFTVFPISQDLVTQRTFMTGTFILATERGNINISRVSSEYCDIEAIADELEGVETAGSILDIGSEFNYCAINKFNFAARTAGM